MTADDSEEYRAVERTVMLRGSLSGLQIRFDAPPYPAAWADKLINVRRVPTKAADPDSTHSVEHAIRLRQTARSDRRSEFVKGADRGLRANAYAATLRKNTTPARDAVGTRSSRQPAGVEGNNTRILNPRPLRQTPSPKPKRSVFLHVRRHDTPRAPACCSNNDARRFAAANGAPKLVRPRWYEDNERDRTSARCRRLDAGPVAARGRPVIRQRLRGRQAYITAVLP